MEHGLWPIALARGGRRQLENRATAVRPTELRRAVERAVLVGDQGSIGRDAVGTLCNCRTESIEHGLCPIALALGGRRQLENRATAVSTGTLRILGTLNPTARRCAVERALLVDDQASNGVDTVGAADKSVEH